MTSLPLAFFKGCTSGNTDPNSPTSPIMTNGSGNVIGNDTHSNYTSIMRQLQIVSLLFTVLSNAFICFKQDDQFRLEMTP